MQSSSQKGKSSWLPCFKESKIFEGGKKRVRLLPFSELIFCRVFTEHTHSSANLSNVKSITSKECCAEILTSLHNASNGL